MRIRTTMTFLWFILAGAVGIFLFLLKYEVQALETHLADLNSSIRSDQQSIHVLKAEWNHLNDPARLRKLSMRHIELKSILPNQLVSFSSLPFNDTDRAVAIVRPDSSTILPKPVKKPARLHVAQIPETVDVLP